MIARVKFSKYGIAKFLGHLDVVRYFQKAIRRSGLRAAYSEGFNPHQLLYFAAPLGLGQTSDAEYMDATFQDPYPPEEIKERLNAALSEGFAIQSVSVFPDWKPNQKKESIMSLTSCADYMISIKDGTIKENGSAMEYADCFAGAKNEGAIRAFQAKMQEYCGREEILVQKAAKKSVRTVNVRPMILAYGFEPEALGGRAEEKIAHADAYQNGIRVFFKLANGSTYHLKPELIFEAFCKEYRIPYQETALQFHRMEIYCDLNARGKKAEAVQEETESGKRIWKLVPLSELGMEERPQSAD